MVVDVSLQHDRVKALLAVVGAVSVRWAGDEDVDSVQGPDALGEVQGMEPCHHLQEIMHLEHGVPQHVLEDTTDLWNSLSSGHLAHTGEVANILQAGRHQLECSDGQPGLQGERQPQSGGLPLQVWVDLVKELLEGGPGHAKGLQPLLIIPGVLDDMQPPVLPSPAGP
ncbi:hypothetical protein Y1Q_0008158 [Alligator mississippiensis]|uniref:Uncharacterized protein n=1 Tax=Alligator mississippiensis TaxID=8496 RepID=A0A151N0Z7_ALLMI|nr:hypothetical protein Y1Q_0008158 [Alligator mississippiensis]